MHFVNKSKKMKKEITANYMNMTSSDKMDKMTNKVDSLARYISKIESLKVKHELCFRGLSKRSYPLVSSLDRSISEDEPYRKWSELEYKLVEFSEQRFPDSFVKQTPVLLIANMQHYGIPTRMMDVTGNALVALYFACQVDEKEEKEEDGQVIVFDQETYSAYNPYANIIADTYRITQNAPTKIEIYRYLMYRQPYFSSRLYPNWEEDKKDDMNVDLVKKPMIVDVGAVNQRQINQGGKFIIFPNMFNIDNTGNEYISNQLIEIEKDSNFVKTIINIPKESKKKILAKLKLCGISEDFLFPDNTEVVCNAIKQAVKNKLYYPD